MWIYNEYIENTKEKLRMDSLGTIIRNARKSKHLTRDQLANMVGRCSNSVTLWEQDMLYPKFPIIVKLTKILELDGNYVLGLIEKEESGLRPDQLPADQREIVSKIYQLTDNEREVINKLLDRIIACRPK